MGMRLGIVSETFSPAEDQSWLGSKHGVENATPITLDADKFLTTFPTGIVPSGVALGKITATGLYAPYTPKNESVSIAVDATAGNWTVTINGQATGNIAFNATAAAVQAAVELLDDVSPGDITVTGGPGASGGLTPYVFKWNGDFEDADAPAITAQDVTLTGGGDALTVTTTAGGGGDGTEKGKGLLLTTQDLHGTTAGTALDTPAALFWHGRVIKSKLPTGHGVDADFEADLPTIRFD
jgi:hypothetical protein